MTCEKTRELLLDRLDGTLPSDLETKVAGHLASCGECRDELDALRDAEAAVHALPKIAAPPDFMSRLRSALDAEDAERARLATCAGVAPESAPHAPPPPAIPLAPPIVRRHRVGLFRSTLALAATVVIAATLLGTSILSRSGGINRMMPASSPRSATAFEDDDTAVMAPSGRLVAASPERGGLTAYSPVEVRKLALVEHDVEAAKGQLAAAISECERSDREAVRANTGTIAGTRLRDAGGNQTRSLASNLSPGKAASALAFSDKAPSPRLLEVELEGADPAAISNVLSHARADVWTFSGKDLERSAAEVSSAARNALEKTRGSASPAAGSETEEPVYLACRATPEEAQVILDGCAPLGRVSVRGREVSDAGPILAALDRLGESSRRREALLGEGRAHGGLEAARVAVGREIARQQRLEKDADAAFERKKAGAEAELAAASRAASAEQRRAGDESEAQEIAKSASKAERTEDGAAPARVEREWKAPGPITGAPGDGRVSDTSGLAPPPKPARPEPVERRPSAPAPAPAASASPETVAAPPAAAATGAPDTREGEPALTPKEGKPLDLPSTGESLKRREPEPERKDEDRGIADEARARGEGAAREQGRAPPWRRERTLPPRMPGPSARPQATDKAGANKGEEKEGDASAELRADGLRDLSKHKLESTTPTAKSTAPSLARRRVVVLIALPSAPEERAAPATPAPAPPAARR